MKLYILYIQYLHISITNGSDCSIRRDIKKKMYNYAAVLCNLALEKMHTMTKQQKTREKRCNKCSSRYLYICAFLF